MHWGFEGRDDQATLITLWSFYAKHTDCPTCSSVSFSAKCILGTCLLLPFLAGFVPRFAIFLERPYKHVSHSLCSNDWLAICTPSYPCLHHCFHSSSPVLHFYSLLHPAHATSIEKSCCRGYIKQRWKQQQPLAFTSFQSCHQAQLLFIILYHWIVQFCIPTLSTEYNSWYI